MNAKGYHKTFQIVDCAMTNLQKIRPAKSVDNVPAHIACLHRNLME